MRTGSSRVPSATATPPAWNAPQQEQASYWYHTLRYEIAVSVSAVDSYGDLPNAVQFVASGSTVRYLTLWRDGVRAGDVLAYESGVVFVHAGVPVPEELPRVVVLLR